MASKAVENVDDVETILIAKELLHRHTIRQVSIATISAFVDEMKFVVVP